MCLESISGSPFARFPTIPPAPDPGEPILTRSVHQAFILLGPLNLGSLQPLVHLFPLHPQVSLRHLACGFYVLVTVEKTKFLRKCDQKGVLNWRAPILSQIKEDCLSHA